MLQLSEEGATQVFRPLTRNDRRSSAAVGVLQFPISLLTGCAMNIALTVFTRAANVYTARWVSCTDEKKLAEFKRKHEEQLAIDGGGYLTYLAPSRANLSLAEERWPEIRFSKTREH